MIPIAEWKRCSIGEVATVFSGGTPSRSRKQYWGGTIPWVTTTEISGGIITTTAQRITELGLSNSSAKLSRPGVLLVAMYGQGKTRGRAAILGIPAAMNQACAAISADESSVDAQFLLHFLNHSYLKIRGMSNSGSQENLSLEIVREIPLHLPQIPEQRVISDVLTGADDLIAALDQMIAKKQAIKQGMMQQLLTGKTRLPGFTALWSDVRLGDVGRTYGGLTGKSKADFGRGNAQFVTFMQVIANPLLAGPGLDAVVVGAHEKQNEVQTGDVLFNGSSETPEEVALGAAVGPGLPGPIYLNSFCFGFRISAESSLDPAFLALFSRSESGRSAIAHLAQGATRYNIAKTKLLQLELTLPPFEEQVAIRRLLVEADSELQLLQTKAVKAKAIKQGMMQELLTGRTRLPVEVDAR